jgi:hypothetical protein
MGARSPEGTPTTPPATRLERWLALDRRYSARMRIAEKPGPMRWLAICWPTPAIAGTWCRPCCWRPWLSGTAAQWLVARLLIGIGVLIVIIFLVKRRFKRRAARR